MAEAKVSEKVTQVEHRVSWSNGGAHNDTCFDSLEKATAFVAQLKRSLEDYQAAIAWDPENRRRCAHLDHRPIRLYKREIVQRDTDCTVIPY